MNSRTATCIKLIVVILFLGLFTTCGGGGGGGVSSGGEPGSLSMMISGNIIAQNFPGLSDKKVNTVLAIPCQRGKIFNESIEYIKTSSINAKGRFSISLDKAWDWMLVLIDSTATKRADQFIGFIELTADPNHNLFLLPVTSAGTSSIDLGTFIASGDSAVSQKTVNADYFSMTKNQLLLMAKNDDQFKLVKNFVINYDSASGTYYGLRPNFNWRGIYANIDGSFNAPEQYSYQQYTLSLGSNVTTLSMDELCSKTLVLKLFPPAEVTTIDHITYSPSNPVSSDQVICKTTADGSIEAKDSDFYASIQRGYMSQDYTAAFSGIIPTGWWQYYENDVLTAQFDVAVAAPNTTDNKISGLVPTIKVNQDSAGKITSIDIKWYYWDVESGKYIEVNDGTVIKHFIPGAIIGLDNTTDSIRTYETISFDPESQSSVSPSKYTWYYGMQGQANQQAKSIGIFYELGGIGHFFDFFQNN